MSKAGCNHIEYCPNCDSYNCSHCFCSCERNVDFEVRLRNYIDTLQILDVAKDRIFVGLRSIIKNHYEGEK